MAFAFLVCFTAVCPEWRRICLAEKGAKSCTDPSQQKPVACLGKSQSRIGLLAFPEQHPGDVAQDAVPFPAVIVCSQPPGAVAILDEEPRDGPGWVRSFLQLIPSSPAPAAKRMWKTRIITQ